PLRFRRSQAFDRLVFAVVLGVLPAGGVGTVGETGFGDAARYMVLPVATLTIASVGGHTRYMRAAMIEVASYFRTAIHRSQVTKRNERTGRPRAPRIG
ncbi:hypothetical protein LCGC14_2925310, partial [marine sediment metagenome]